MRILVVAGLVMLAGCVTAMSAQQFYTEFPKATGARYLTGAEAIEAQEDGRCKAIDDHVYNAPIGMTVQGDVRAGAEGIDGIVANDGGNSYRITNFSWLPVGDGSGATQLRVVFDTMLCD